MGFEDDLEELEQLVETEAVPAVRETGWTDELGLWLAAWIFEEFGQDALTRSDALCESVGVDAVDKVADTLMEVFRPPTILVETPFPNAEMLWWECVSRLLESGQILKRDGSLCLPNFDEALELWAAGIEEEYGFSFTSTKLDDVESELEFHTREAGRVMAAKRNGGSVSQESLRDAARILAGRSVVSRRRAADEPEESGEGDAEPDAEPVEAAASEG